MKIYKYQFGIKSLQHIEIPLGAKILSVQAQRGALCLWALVDPDPGAVTRAHPIRVYGTGHPCDEDPRNFIGTVQTNEGALVWHVFGDLV